MGMAASQARYLGLTARKTNTEWEGQQINQQRTALANQSANLFNQLLTMEVPTPPSKDDYTNIQYSFNDGNHDQILESYQQLNTSDPDYNYMVTHYYYADKYTGSQKTLQDPQVQRGLISTKVQKTATSATENATDSTYTVTLADGSAITYQKYDETTANDSQKAKVQQLINDGYLTSGQIYFDSTNIESFVSQNSLNTLVDGSSTSYNIYGADEDFKYIGNSLLTGIKKGSMEASDKTELEQIVTDFPESAIAIAYQEGQTLYKFQRSGVTYYACENDLRASYNSAMDPTKPIEAQATALKYYNALNIKDKVSTTEKALIETDGNGRFTSIKFESDSVVYSIDTETVTDDISYEDAMNQYNYDVAVYEKEVADINAKTEKIQQQDRTLELRLKQLDTEQNALATEMEAVKKVIDDNVKATFKTFND